MSFWPSGLKMLVERSLRARPTSVFQKVLLLGPSSCTRSMSVPTAMITTMFTTVSSIELPPYWKNCKHARAIIDPYHVNAP